MRAFTILSVAIVMVAAASAQFIIGGDDMFDDFDDRFDDRFDDFDDGLIVIGGRPNVIGGGVIGGGVIGGGVIGGGVIGGGGVVLPAPVPGPWCKKRGGYIQSTPMVQTVATPYHAVASTYQPVATSYQSHYPAQYASSYGQGMYQSTGMSGGYHGMGGVSSYPSQYQQSYSSGMSAYPSQYQQSYSTGGNYNQPIVGSSTGGGYY